MSHVDQFITERKYLKNVSPKTVLWYEGSFKAFEGAIESRSAIVARIAELRQRNVSAISVNTYLRCINSYLRWLHTEHGQELLRIPRLKEEQKVLATLSAEQVKSVIQFKPKGRNETGAHTIALVLRTPGFESMSASRLPNRMSISTISFYE